MREAATFSTANTRARQIRSEFEAIRARNGHAAIDFCDGELVLRCSRPSEDREEWGKTAVPKPYDKWVRLAEC